MSGGDKRIVIYLDVFFGINLVMDLVVLYCTKKICKFSATFLRILLSATLGALWSVLAVIAPKGIKGIVHICTYVLISTLMIRICAGKSDIKDIIKGVAVLYAVTFGLAGGIYMVYYYTYAGYWIREVLLADKKLLFFTAVSLGLLALIYIQIRRLGIYGEHQCIVELTLLGSSVRLKGYIDTGNVLTDPLFKKPVSVVYAQALSQGENGGIIDIILNDIEVNTKVKYHMVPYRSLGCENGLLEVITVDTMYIYRGKKVYKQENALIGLSRSALSSDNEFDVLVNSAVIAGGKVKNEREKSEN